MKIQKFASFATGILLLPIFAACTPNDTAQDTTITPPPGTDVNTPDLATTPTTPPVTPGATVDDDIADVVEDNPSLKTLANLIDEADLEDTLDDDGPYTLFAPSDQAFAAIPEATRQRLLQPENRDTLRQVLTYHVVQGNLRANQLQSGEVQTLANNPVNVQVDQASNQVRVNEATVTQPDIQASNGVIHIIDQVILPPNLNL
ncbi:MAG: fasciclin domain-containing protein [Richelia sp. RM2_1_2]|nr:fasciclin domain-containing protein [Richelia sp. SM2_1_7]NJM20531.1 fasciclin domain-containing protein [Richelia sp. SM1_7_0]NJN08252.1 fasciclin domain-containing protein [Richelia sp. RM1_1_1]NJO27304.1 fasciclin domain-containing protein [Richelia sp. SL_2_1]NJO59459.1 fasciclin domain-containing protein [Richelia sp. RM2_1_2]